MRVRVPRRCGVSARSQKRSISADEADSAEHRTLDAPRAMEVGAGPGEPTPASPAIVRPAVVLPAVVNDTFPTAGADLPPRAARSHPRPTAARQQPLPLINETRAVLVAGCSPATPALSGRAGSCPLGTLPGALAAPRAPGLALARARSRGQHVVQRLSPPIRLAVGSLRSRPLSAHLARSQEPQQWVPRRTASTTHQDAGFLVAQTHRLRALSKALSEKDSGLARTRFSNLLRFFRVFAKIVFARCLKRFAFPKSARCDVLGSANRSANGASGQHLYL